MMLRGLITLFLIFSGSWVSANDTVVFRADYWYPFNGYPNSLKPGFMIEIARRAFAKESITVDYQIMPWESSLENARKGNIDCVLGASKNENRGLLYPENSFGMTDTGFYAHVGTVEKFDYQGLASLRKFRIGLVEGAVHIEDPAVQNYIQKYQTTDRVFLSSANNPLRDLMTRLVANEIDLIIETPAVFKAVAEQQRLSILFEQVALLGDPSPVYIACSKANPKSPHYLKLLDEQLLQMRKSGELDLLLKRYGLTDWQ